MVPITCIIPHYNRERNMQAILDGIKSQSVPSIVWVWDNSYELSAVWMAKGVDSIIKSSINFGCYARFALAGLVQTEYIFTQDDDFAITDDKLFENLIVLSQERPDFYIGVKGKNYGDFSDQKKPYQCGGGWVDEGECMSVNTGLSFFRTELINRLPKNPFQNNNHRATEEELKYGDDMYVSAQMKCYTYRFYDHVKLLNECDHGLSHETPHMDVRNALAKRYWL